MQDLMTLPKNAVAKLAPAKTETFVTLVLNHQLFGIPIDRVRDILTVDRVFRVPLSPQWVDGNINVRGRIVMVVDLRNFMGLEKLESSRDRRFCINVTHGHELYGLIVDKVGDVMTLEPGQMQPVPSTVSNKWKSLSRGVYCLDGRKLLLWLDVDAILGPVKD